MKEYLGPSITIKRVANQSDIVTGSGENFIVDWIDDKDIIIDDDFITLD